MLEKKIKTIQDEINYYKEINNIYSYLLYRGDNLLKKPSLLQNQYKVDGCVSLVWLKLENRKSKLYIEGYSDSLIVRGIIDIIIYLYHEECIYIVCKKIKHNLTIDLELSDILSPQRTNGLFSIIDKIRLIAQAD